MWLNRITSAKMTDLELERRKLELEYLKENVKRVKLENEKLEKELKQDNKK